MTSADQKDPIFELADMVVAQRSDDIPRQVLDFQKTRMIDNIGCALAGAMEVGVHEAMKMWSAERGSGQCTVFSHNLKLPLKGAVFVNALQARALDYCDAIPPGYHPSSTDIPIAIAVAEYVGASGKEVLTALALGQDVAQRINRAAHKPQGLYKGFDSNVLGLFSGTTIAGRLLSLSASELADALGLAFSHGIGSFQANKDKSHAVRLIQSFVARDSVESALLAQQGLRGLKKTLTGELGFYEQYTGQPGDETILLDGLGVVFHGLDDTIFKLYPSCGVTLALTQAALAIHEEARISPEAIKKIALIVSPTMQLICGDKFDQRTATNIDAMFSIEYAATNALLRGKSTLQEYTLPSIRHEKITALLTKVEVSVEPAFGYDECQIVVTDQTDNQYRHKAQFGLGWPQNPLSASQLQFKFRDCVKFAGFERQKADDILNCIQGLESAHTLDALIACIANSPTTRGKGSIRHAS